MRAAFFCTIAIGGVFAATAAMAAATQVNIADPNATTRVAKVEVGNRLAVQEVSPSTFYHATKLDVTNGTGCVVVATPPTGKALIVRQVRLDVWTDPSPGDGQFVGIYLGASCNSTTDIAELNPTTIGQYIVPLDPGLAVPNGSALSVIVGGSVGIQVYVDAYKVDSSVVPEAGGQTIQVSGKRQQ